MARKARRASLAIAAYFALCATAVADDFTGPTTPRGKPEFDPSVCAQHADGKYYIALGRNVLGLPPTGTVVIGNLNPGTGFDRLVPPDMGAPKGCYDNPEQLANYSFAYGLAPPGKPPGPDLLQLFRTLPGDARSSAGGREWPGETLQRDIAEHTCQRATVTEELPSGLTACRIKPSPEAHLDRIEDWAASYIANPKIYTAPDGKTFVVPCGPGLFSGPAGQCEVAYTMAEGLGVYYRFQPYLGPTPIHIDHIIEFDRHLRQEIEAVVVRNYPWRP
jgi:hypothetical protein